MQTLRVLIVEDSPAKIAKVEELLSKEADIVSVVAKSTIAGKVAMEKEIFDVLILDQHLPEHDGEKPRASEGLSMLRELHALDRLHKPFEIVIFSEFETYKAGHDAVSHYGWFWLSYQSNSDEWQSILVARLRNLKRSLARLRNPRYLTDFALVTALEEPEFTDFKSALFPSDPLRFGGDVQEYYSSHVDTPGGKRSIIGMPIRDMGLVSASVKTAELINRFRPRFVVMAGIAGRVGKEVKIGDLIIAAQSWNYDAGKWIERNGQLTHLPEPLPVPINEALRVHLAGLVSNSQLKSKLRKIGLSTTPPIAECTPRIGPVVSGSAVVESESIINRIRNVHRKTLALDMEIFGVYFACKNACGPKPTFLGVKAISDKAVPKGKTDRYRGAAARICASFVELLLREHGDKLLEITTDERGERIPKSH